MTDSRALAEAFNEVFGREPEGVWHAPGRVNLIGEHTDYNDGFVLPFALGLGVSVAAARRGDGVVEVRSRQAAAAVTAPVDGGPVVAEGWPPERAWAAYPVGTARVLRERGTGGASLLIDSDLPQGAGLSSSAALECATALALCDLHGAAVDRPALARLAQRAENEQVGVPCGPMDQAASLLCTAGHALLLDCRSGLSSQVPFAPAGSGMTLLVVDTRAAHALAGGEYARRRAECEEAAALLGVAALRDVKDLAGALGTLRDPVLRRRVQHVVTENHRVEATVGLLRAGAVTELGAMLNASHLSLRDQFEVSWPEADATVDAALRAGARGGRMVGGGFGGSVLVLTAADRAARVRDAVAAAYAERGWTAPEFIEAVPSAGARRVTPA
ncbi:galactokinase [Actinomadura livida]|uniref:Galactokinase n=1 Tax=Actinomadura livida TaxID=79909 RepID=A0A7W7IJY8_9ACTN|nr:MULTISPECIES: galactokinase [Actinomadura]MBB4778083.1 galactokinase [Actinomadura catellatispora]GGT96664.1 galactokinase [Actinomadura livida]